MWSNVSTLNYHLWKRCDLIAFHGRCHDFYIFTMSKRTALTETSASIRGTASWHENSTTRGSKPKFRHWWETHGHEESKWCLIAYVCVLVCACVCLCVCIQACVCMFMQVTVCVYTYMQAYACACLCVCMQGYKPVYACMCAHVCICANMCVCMCACVCLHVGTCVCVQRGWRSTSNAIYLCFEDRELSLTRSSSVCKDWLARKPQESTCLHLPRAAIRNVHTTKSNF